MLRDRDLFEWSAAGIFSDFMLDESIVTSGLEKGPKSQEKKEVVNVTFKWKLWIHLYIRTLKAGDFIPKHFFD